MEMKKKKGYNKLKVLNDELNEEIQELKKEITGIFK